MRSSLPLSLLAVLALVMAGCSSSPGATHTSTSGDSTSAATTSQAAGVPTGTFVLRVTDAPDDLGDFTALIVGVSQIRLTGDGGNQSYAPSTPFFDLVQLQNGTTETLFADQVPAGAYQGIVLEVETAVGTLAATGDVVNVTLPGGRLLLNRPFTVSMDEQTIFTLDVQVHRLGNGDYQLQPNAAGSYVGENPPGVRPTPTSRAPTSRSSTSTSKAATTTSKSGTSSSTSSAPPPPPATKLNLWVTLQGNASAFKHLNVTLSAVMLKGPSGNATYTPNVAKLDLAKLKNGTVALAWNRTVAPGNYTHFELRVASTAAAGTNQTLNATVSGGKLALTETVQVPAGATTNVLLAVQAQKTATGYLLVVDPVASGAIPKPVNGKLV